MPEMNGLEQFEAVREHSDIPFFLLTAAADDDTIAKVERADVTGLVRKGAGIDHYTDLAESIVEAVQG